MHTKPDLSKAIDVVRDSLRTNTFEVVFTNIPNAPQSVLERLPFLCFQAQLPGIERGVFNSAPHYNLWSVSVYADLEIYDTFHDWLADELSGEAKSAEETTVGEASINVYRLDGTLQRRYTLMGLKIHSVDSISLNWEPANSLPILNLAFSFDSIERDAPVPQQ